MKLRTFQLALPIACLWIAAAGAIEPAVPPVEGRRLALTPAVELVNDATITARVKASLLSDPALAGADISVSSSHGMVILIGMVKSHEQAGIASSHAQRQDGVMGVDNQLTLMLQ